MAPRALTAFAGLVAQLFFVAAGVYLGIRAEDYRDQRTHRATAVATLRNLRDELRRNRERLAATQPYHKRLGDRFLALQGHPMPRGINAMFRAVDWHGIHPLSFRHAAWDLALANQSLGDIEPRLAFDLSDVYEAQQSLIRYQESTLQSTLTPASLRDDATGGLSFVLAAFLTDAGKYQEPELLHGYDVLLGRLDAALAHLPR